MKQIVFYSWQSDLPNSCNRGFIHNALEAATDAIASDSSVAIEPVVDRDTKGVPGSPDIGHTIFSKIAAADAFVADVSIVVRDHNRAMPNPNVLVELGYALKALGPERVILLFNKAFGKVEELPFDLRARRVLAYEMPEESASRSAERRALQKTLEQAIRSALPNPAMKDGTPKIPAISAIESQSANRLLVLRRNLASILEAVDKAKPRPHSQGGTVEELLDGISATQQAIAEFSKVVETIAALSDSEAAREVVRWFGNFYPRFHPAQDFTRSYSDADFDYFKFVGHEMFVTLIAFLLREGRWGILESVLDETIPTRYIRRHDGPGVVTWTFLSDHSALLINEGRKRQRTSFHGDILKERHTVGGLAAILPFEEFVEGDFFLYLVGEIRESVHSNWGFAWRPWSNIYLKSTPVFLVHAQKSKLAESLLRVLEETSLVEARSKILEAAKQLEKLFSAGWWVSPISTDAVEAIGTK